MSIMEQIEIAIRGNTGNNIPCEVVTINKVYPNNTCDINTSKGVLRNVRCSGSVDNNKQGLLMFEDGKQDKPFVLLFNDLKDYYTKEEVDDLISGGTIDLKKYVKKEDVNLKFNLESNGYITIGIDVGDGF